MDGRWWRLIFVPILLTWGLPLLVAAFRVATRHRHVPLPTDPTVAFHAARP
ncbi:hypothetical protein ACIB24_16685 [Spongisporangium articulatum]|uniref:Uncharacterized protein n=1 Tax=Spongisporangium articulatum TaxID=3362603 RepID=A0ABW8ARJ4_9ACTN